MTMGELFEESILVLTTNKMRTALSALGIIIGIGSVITLMTLGQASQQSVKTRIQSLGANLLTIRPGNQQQGFLTSSNSNTNLTYEDMVAISEEERITTVAAVAAEYSSRAQVSFEGNNSNTQIYGIADDYFELRNIKLGIGRELIESDNIGSAKVAIIGPDLANELFGDANTGVGNNIRISGQTFKVVGIAAAKGGGGPMGSSDEAVYIPLQTAQKALFGVSHLSTIYVGAKSEDEMDAAQNQVGYFLLERHGLDSPDSADFSIFSQDDILETASQITQTFTSLLTGIAAISLIVGGIGIMNIMLVTVTERTSEIGLRKALGAKKKTIILQFLIEAIVLTITGGMIGVVIGLIASKLLIKIMSLPNTLSLPAIAISVCVSGAIGIIFGLYPAYKASRLQPIDALRYE